MEKSENVPRKSCDFSHNIHNAWRICNRQLDVVYADLYDLKLFIDLLKYMSFAHYKNYITYILKKTHTDWPETNRTTTCHEIIFLCV